MYHLVYHLYIIIFLCIDIASSRNMMLSKHFYNLRTFKKNSYVITKVIQINLSLKKVFSLYINQFHKPAGFNYVSVIIQHAPTWVENCSDTVCRNTAYTVLYCTCIATKITI